MENIMLNEMSLKERDRHRIITVAHTVSNIPKDSRNKGQKDQFSWKLATSDGMGVV